MAKHVDTTRTPDQWNANRLARWERELLTGVPTPHQAHRKPGEPVTGTGSDTRYQDPRDATRPVRRHDDVWSGNPDTDRAWRERIITHEIGPLHQRQSFERR